MMLCSGYNAMPDLLLHLLRSLDCIFDKELAQQVRGFYCDRFLDFGSAGSKRVIVYDICAKVLRLPFDVSQCCRTAARVFSHWQEVGSSDTASVTTDLRQLVGLLQEAHTELRNGALLNWAAPSVPGPHLQTLLELVLAARRVFPDDDGTTSKPPPVGAVPLLTSSPG